MPDDLPQWELDLLTGPPTVSSTYASRSRIDDLEEHVDALASMVQTQNETIDTLLDAALSLHRWIDALILALTVLSIVVAIVAFR